MSFVSQLFNDKLTQDDRVPFMYFNIPFLDDTYGTVAPRLTFQTQLIFLITLQRFISAALAVIVFNFIVKKQGTATAFLTGFGIVIPLALIFPFWVLDWLDLRSLPLRLSILTLPLSLTFRCSEAMFGYVPSFATVSLKSFCIYYASLMEIVLDPATNKPVRATNSDIAAMLREFLYQNIVYGILSSLFSPVSYVPFKTNVPSHEGDRTFVDFFHVGHLLNTYVAATLLSMSLAFGSTGNNLFYAILFRIKLDRLVDNPMFASTSPAEFWGRRWNKMIHAVLKRGVYKPVYKSFSKTTAIFATFLASGSIHEYSWLVMFYVHKNQKNSGTGLCATCVYPTYGKNMFFFGWNGLIIILQHMIGGFWLFGWMENFFPSPCIAALVVMTALPVGHLFTDDWIAGKYYEHLQLGVPLIIATGKQ